jgi:hypothetical protein
MSWSLSPGTQRQCHKGGRTVASPLNELADWLVATPASDTIKNISWIIPLTQTTHILGIAAVISATGMIDLRVLGLAGRSQSLASVVSRLLPWIWYALIVLLLTGSILIIGEPGRSLVNPIFQLKMGLLLAAIALTLLLRTGISKTLNAGGASAPLGVKLIALLSLALWIAILFAGRWIAYGDTLFDNAGL